MTKVSCLRFPECYSIYVTEGPKSYLIRIILVSARVLEKPFIEEEAMPGVTTTADTAEQVR